MGKYLHLLPLRLQSRLKDAPVLFCFSSRCLPQRGWSSPASSLSLLRTAEGNAMQALSPASPAGGTRDVKPPAQAEAGLHRPARQPAPPPPHPVLVPGMGQPRSGQQRGLLTPLCTMGPQVKGANPWSPRLENLSNCSWSNWVVSLFLIQLADCCAQKSPRDVGDKDWRRL